MPGKGSKPIVAVAIATAIAATAPPALGAGFDSPRYVADQRGDLTVVGNTILSCSDRSPGCKDARRGKGRRLDNNDHNMTFIDVDADKKTFNSSSATLRLPVPGSQVTFAGLYWGGDLRNTKGKSEKRPPDEGKRNRVLFAAPGAGYVRVGTGGKGELQHENTRYVGFADVTEIVQAAGAGRYAVAEIQVAEGDYGFGGWHMVVAWRDESDPLRNITVFDGVQLVGKQGRTDALKVPISGFQTLPAGSIKAKLLTVGLDGDLGRGGDRIRFEKEVLGNAANPDDNYFNSTISERGKDGGGKQPDFVNQLGYDIDSVGVTNLLDHNQTKGLFDFRTDADRFSPTLFAFRIDTVIPDMTIDKTTLGGLVAGATGFYRLVATNSGTEATTAPVAVTDTLPAELTPTAAAGAGWTCTISGPDVSCSRADSAPFGASFPPIDISVAVSPSAEGTVTNTAVVAGGGESDDANSTDSVTDPVARVSDLAVDKTVSESTIDEQQPISYTIVVTNHGPTPEPAPALSDVLPTAGSGSYVENLSVATADGSCTISGASQEKLDCAIEALDPGETATVVLSGTTTYSDGTNTGDVVTNTATVAGENSDPVSANNTDTASYTVGN